MAKNSVNRAGVVVSQGRDGRLEVNFWYCLEEGRHHEEHYDGLVWTEAVDVIIAELDAHRPGWQLGEGWRQPTLNLDPESA